MMKKIINAALLAAVIFAQPPQSTFMNTDISNNGSSSNNNGSSSTGSNSNTDVSNTDVSNTDMTNTNSGSSSNGGSDSMPPHVIDWLTVSTSLMFPNAYPLDTCVVNSLSDNSYVKYTCNAFGTMIHKDVYSTSTCSGNSTSGSSWNSGVYDSGFVGYFNCDGVDRYFNISSSSCSTSSSKVITIVPNVCFYDSADSDNIHDAYRWNCSSTDSGATLSVQTTSTANNCAGSSTTITISSTTCTTIPALGSLSVKASSICVVEDGTSSSANNISLNIMWLFSLLFVLVLV